MRKFGPRIANFRTPKRCGTFEYFSQLRLKNHNKCDNGHLAEVAENPLQAFKIQDIRDEEYNRATMMPATIRQVPRRSNVRYRKNWPAAITIISTIACQPLIPFISAEIAKFP